MPTEHCVNLEFSYDTKYHTDIEPGHWFDVYTDVVYSMILRHRHTNQHLLSILKQQMGIHDVSKETQNIIRGQL